MRFLQSSRVCLLAAILVLVTSSIAVMSSIGWVGQTVLVRQTLSPSQPSQLPVGELYDEGDQVTVGTGGGVEENVVPLKYTLTGGTNLTSSTILSQLTQCTRHMGVSEVTLRDSAPNIATIATRLLLFLQAIQSIVPQQFSDHYTNPCWYSTIQFTPDTPGELKLAKLENQQEMDARTQSFLHHRLLDPALTASPTTLLCLPSFFLAGFTKSATTTLHTALSHHPSIASPNNKEPHWWTREPLADLNQRYLRLTVLQYLYTFYPASKNIEAVVDGELLTYDGSQSILWDSNFFIDSQDFCSMPIAISHILPNAKFVVLMREPVGRTYSHFLYSCSLQYGSDIKQWPPAMRWDQATLFHHQAKATIRSFNSCLANSSVFECVNKHRFADSKCGYVGYKLVLSMYYIHLQKWMQLYSRENFLFLRTEDLSREPKIVAKKISEFLGVKNTPLSWAKEWLTQRVNKQNFMKAKRVVLRMRPDTEELLTEFFIPYNKQLAEMAGDERFLWKPLIKPHPLTTPTRL